MRYMIQRLSTINLFLTILVLAPLSAVAQESPESWRSITPDVVYGHKMGMALTYDVVSPTEGGNGAGVLFMVSGGWVSRYSPPAQLIRADKQQQLNLWESIVAEGYTLYLVRHGSSPLFKVPDAVADVRLAIRHIRAHCADLGVDAERLGVCGGSAGGHLSLMLGTTGESGVDGSNDRLESAGSRVGCVVAYFPPTEIEPLVNPDGPYYDQFPALHFAAEEAGAISPLRHVSADDAPTLLVHGDQDRLVPLFHSEKIHKRFEEEGVPSKLVVIDGAAHGFRGDDNLRAQQELIDWFNRYLIDAESDSQD